jgi:hypothetical protein
MSAALLRNNKKCSALGEDREFIFSCADLDSLALQQTYLHARKYTPESRSTKPQTVLREETFPVMSRPHLDALIGELTGAFAVRYEEPPSAEQSANSNA